jgi:hypothetical protein
MSKIVRLQLLNTKNQKNDDKSESESEASNKSSDDGSDDESDKELDETDDENNKNETEQEEQNSSKPVIFIHKSGVVKPITYTKSGRPSKSSVTWAEESEVGLALTEAEVTYQEMLKNNQFYEFIRKDAEFACIGAASLGTEVKNTNELKVMKYDEAMVSEDSGE